MAFNEDGFAPSSATSSPAPILWRYNAGADTRATVEEADYFSFAEVWQKAETGDVITVIASDATVMYNMTVTDNVATGSVSISTGTEIQ
tara:strand:- start:827 stop:1093 length:267 start_codon:yes stop_codon:yes gene_type:complete